MRHPKTDALELQMEALLRSAADFEPELEAPFDLVERAMRRATRQIAVVRVQRPIVALLWGSAAGAAAASAAAAFLITSPTAPDDPLKPRVAGFGAAVPSFQVTADGEAPDAPQPSEARRSFRVRTVPPRALLAEQAPAPKVTWQTEEVVQAVEHTVRPALRIQVDEQGQPVDLDTGYLETLTVSETPAACGAPEGEQTGDDLNETTGGSRSKEADLPSKED